VTGGCDRHHRPARRSRCLECSRYQDRAGFPGAIRSANNELQPHVRGELPPGAGGGSRPDDGPAGRLPYILWCPRNFFAPKSRGLMGIGRKPRAIGLQVFRIKPVGEKSEIAGLAPSSVLGAVHQPYRLIARCCCAHGQLPSVCPTAISPRATRFRAREKTAEDAIRLALPGARSRSAPCRSFRCSAMSKVGAGRNSVR
jgi:hypothetical protein